MDNLPPVTIAVSGWTRRAEGRDRNVKTTVYCTAEQCPLLARNLCIHAGYTGSILSHKPCQFGRFYRTTGLTARAKEARAEHARFVEQIAELRDGQGPAKSYTPTSMVIIGGWIMLPYDFITLIPAPWTRPGHTLSPGVPWMRLEDLTPQMVVKLAEARPHSLMGGEIPDYQKKSVSAFLYDLKFWLPDIYAAACELTPKSRMIENRTAGPEFYADHMVPVATLPSPTTISMVGHVAMEGIVARADDGWELSTANAGTTFWDGRDTTRQARVVFPLLNSALVRPSAPEVTLALYEVGAYCTTLVFKEAAA